MTFYASAHLLRSFPSSSSRRYTQVSGRHAVFVIPAGIAGIHDCTDAGGRATQEQLPKNHGGNTEAGNKLCNAELLS